MIEKLVQYRKLGGWLMLFHIFNIIGAGFSLISVLSTALNWSAIVSLELIPTWMTIMNVAVSALGVVLRLLISWYLLKRNRKFVLTFYILTALQLLSSVASSVLAPAANTALLPPLFATLLFVVSWAFTLLPPLAWILYFHRSARVKVYLMEEGAYRQYYMEMSNRLHPADASPLS